MSISQLSQRAGRWSVRHRRRAIVAWLVFTVLAVGLGGAAGLHTIGLNDKGTGESGRADRVLNQAGFSQPARERVSSRAHPRPSASPRRTSPSA